MRRDRARESELDSEREGEREREGKGQWEGVVKNAGCALITKSHGLGNSSCRHTQQCDSLS